MKNIERNIIVIVSVLIVFVIYNKWLLSLGYITHGDWSYFNEATLSSLRINYFSLWLDDFNFGRVLIDIGQAPTYAFYGILSKFFSLGFNISERVVHLWPIIALNTFGTYFFLKRRFGTISSLIGMFVYSFNSYMLILQTGHLTLAAAFSFAPLIFLSFEKLFCDSKEEYLVILVLLSSLCVSYEPRAFYIIAGILLLYFIFISFSLKSNNIRKNLYLGVLAFLLFILINFYWLFGLIAVGDLQSNDILSRDLFGNKFWNILYSFSLHHPWWSGEYITTFINQPIPIYFWIIPLVSLMGLILNKSSRNIFFFAIIGLIGIFLSKQVVSPFPQVYPWLFENFPGFNAFREASKFYFLVAFSYSILVANFVEYIYNKIERKKISKLYGVIIILSILTIVLINTKPIINEEIGRTFTIREIPKDYLTLNSFILEDNSFSRMLWMPRHSRWGVYTSQHPRLSFIDLMDGKWINLSRQDFSAWDRGHEAINMLNQNYSSNLLDISSIKYIIIPINDSENDDDFFRHYGANQSYYISELDKINYLNRINITTEELALYENEDFLDNIYGSTVSQSLEKLDKNAIFLTTHAEISPAKHKITFNETKPFYLYFSESYHQKWKLTQKSGWIRGFNEDNFVFDDTHFEAYGFLNGWYIDPSTLEKNDNDDYELYVYFKPQSYFYLGLLISGTTLILCIGYLIYDWRRDKNARHEVN